MIFPAARLLRNAGCSVSTHRLFSAVDQGASGFIFIFQRQSKRSLYTATYSGKHLGSFASPVEAALAYARYKANLAASAALASSQARAATAESSALLRQGFDGEDSDMEGAEMEDAMEARKHGGGRE